MKAFDMLQEVTKEKRFRLKERLKHKESWNQLLKSIDQLQPIFDKIDTLMKRQQFRFIIKKDQIYYSGSKQEQLYKLSEKSPASIWLTNTGEVRIGLYTPIREKHEGKLYPNQLKNIIYHWVSEQYTTATMAATDEHGYLRCTVCGDKALLASAGEDVCPDCKRKHNE